MRVEGILRRHAPAHDGVEEGFPLASVEPQDLVIRRHRFRQNIISLLTKSKMLLVAPTQGIYLHFKMHCSVKHLQHVIHTSILPPTRASKGGRGLSFSFFSCRRECLRPPTKKTPNASSELSRALSWAQNDLSVLCCSVIPKEQK